MSPPKELATEIVDRELLYGDQQSSYVPLVDAVTAAIETERARTDRVLATLVDVLRLSIFVEAYGGRTLDVEVGREIVAKARSAVALDFQPAAAVTP